MEESESNKNNRPSSLPANYVTLLQLKERWLKEKELEQKEKEEQEQEKEEEERLQREKEERERAQKEEEELRQQKLKEEVAKSQKPDGVVVVMNYRRRFDRREFQSVDRREFQSVDRREFRPVDRNVSECEGAQLEGKIEEPEEKKKKKKKKKKGSKKKGQDRKKNNKAENEEVSTEKEGAVQAAQERSQEGNSAFRRNGERKRIRFEFRAKSTNGEEEIEPKFRDLALNGETEKGDGRPNRRNAGAKEKIEPKVRDLVMKGETERGNDDRLRRPNRRNAGAKEEIEPKVRNLSMNGGTGDDRLRGPNSKEEIEPKVRDLSTERGKDRFRSRKGKNVGGSDETESKIRDLTMNAETERGDDRLWRPRRFDHRGNGKTWDHKKEKLREGPGLAWVKKGEASDGNVGEVQSSEHFISGSTGTSLNASSLKSAGTGRVIQYRVSEANAN